MQYIKPQILTSLRSTSVIQQVDHPSSDGKIGGIATDNFNGLACTPGAYEADE